MPDSERVLVSEANKSRSPSLDRLVVVGWVLARRVIPWCIAGLSFALRNNEYSKCDFQVKGEECRG